MTENDTDKLLARLKDMEDNIVNRLEVKLTDKIRDITDNALQKVHQSINSNAEAIRQITDDLSPVKKNLCDTIANVENMQHDITDNHQRIKATVKSCELADLRFASIEQELDKKNTEL